MILLTLAACTRETIHQGVGPSADRPIAIGLFMNTLGPARGQVVWFSSGEYIFFRFFFEKDSYEFMIDDNGVSTPPIRNAWSNIAWTAKEISDGMSSSWSCKSRSWRRSWDKEALSSPDRLKMENGRTRNNALNDFLGGKNHDQKEIQDLLKAACCNFCYLRKSRYGIVQEWNV